MRKLKRPLLMGMLMGCLLLPALHAAEPDKVEVIELQNRTPDELIPALAPMVPNAVIKGFQGKLMVKGSPEAIANVKSLVDSLDVPAKNLNIHLKQVSAKDIDADSFQVCGKMQSQTAQFSLHCADQGSSDDVVRTLRNNESLAQDVTVVSGGIAEIKEGFELPYVSTIQNGISPQSGISYKPIFSGFFVKPVLLKDAVKVLISSSRQKLSDSDGSQVDTHAMVTELRVPLDQWVNIGGTTTDAGANPDADTYGTQRADRGEASVWMKVEVVGP